MKVILLINTVLVLSSCVSLLDDNGIPDMFTSTPLFLGDLPSGDDMYSSGFRDGCYNAVGANGFGWNRVHDRAANPDDGIFTNELYQRGYHHGDRHCSVYVNKGTIL